MITQEKQGLRREMKEKLKTMSGTMRSELSELLVKELQNEPRWEQSKRIFGFFPLQSEPLWLPALLPFQKLYLPKVFSDTMVFYRVETVESLPMGSYGVREPHGDTEAALPKREDLVLVPGVAFTEEGSRLGRGRGYYDRWLSESQAPAWGVCFPFQKLKAIPMESHDCLVDRVFCGDKECGGAWLGNLR